MPNSPGLIQALIHKMDFHAQRQKVLADNVSNADTPDFKPKDLVPMDFKAVLKETSTIKSSKGVSAGSLATTNSVHIGAQTDGTMPDAKDKVQKRVYETAPAGNAVVLEEQMIKLSENVMDYNLTSSTYAKFIGMMRTALGNRA